MGRGFCFYAQTMAGASPLRRLEAAVAGGFGSMSLIPTDCPNAAAVATLRGACEEAGVRLRSLDAFSRWLPGWNPPPGLPDEFHAVVGAPEENFFAQLEALEPEAMTIIEPFAHTYETGALVESFARICDRGAELGVKVQLEFSPVTGIPDLASAWEIVAGADHPNGGICFDTYSYYRGRRDDALLAAIPGEKLFAIHVNDGLAEPPVDGDLIDETMHRRLLPGQGEWDLAVTLGILVAKPGLGDFGVEINSDVLAALPPAEVGARSAAALGEVLALAAGRAA